MLSTEQQFIYMLQDVEDITIYLAFYLRKVYMVFKHYIGVGGKPGLGHVAVPGECYVTTYIHTYIHTYILILLGVEFQQIRVRYKCYTSFKRLGYIKVQFRAPQTCTRSNSYLVCAELELVNHIYAMPADMRENIISMVICKQSNFSRSVSLRAHGFVYISLKYFFKTNCCTGYQIHW